MLILCLKIYRMYDIRAFQDKFIFRETHSGNLTQSVSLINNLQIVNLIVLCLITTMERRNYFHNNEEINRFFKTSLLLYNSINSNRIRY